MLKLANHAAGLPTHCYESPTPVQHHRADRRPEMKPLRTNGRGCPLRCRPMYKSSSRRHCQKIRRQRQEHEQQWALKRGHRSVPMLLLLRLAGCRRTAGASAFCGRCCHLAVAVHMAGCLAIRCSQGISRKPASTACREREDKRIQLFLNISCWLADHTNDKEDTNGVPRPIGPVQAAFSACRTESSVRGGGRTELTVGQQLRLEGSPYATVKPEVASKTPPRNRQRARAPVQHPASAAATVVDPAIVSRGAVLKMLHRAC